MGAVSGDGGVGGGYTQLLGSILRIAKPISSVGCIMPVYVESKINCVNRVQAKLQEEAARRAAADNARKRADDDAKRRKAEEEARGRCGLCGSFLGVLSFYSCVFLLFCGPFLILRALLFDFFVSSCRWW